MLKMRNVKASKDADRDRAFIILCDIADHLIIINLLLETMGLSHKQD